LAKSIEVVAAVIFQDGKVLCVQRAENEKEYVSLKWEFPGGKVEVGESMEEALMREIEEELAVEIHELQYLMTVEHSYPDFDLTMHAYTCALTVKEVTLKEHVATKWLAVEELNQLDWASADVPVVKRLMFCARN
jgi:8-oxo-dGTP diphosphatase